jgi:hypothetical protein
MEQMDFFSLGIHLSSLLISFVLLWGFLLKYVLPFIFKSLKLRNLLFVRGYGRMYRFSISYLIVLCLEKSKSSMYIVNSFFILNNICKFINLQILFKIKKELTIYIELFLK